MPSPIQVFQDHFSAINAETTTARAGCPKTGGAGPQFVDLPKGSTWRGRLDATAANKTDHTVSIVFTASGAGGPASMTDAQATRANAPTPPGGAAPMSSFGNVPADQDFYLEVFSETAGKASEQLNRVWFLWDGGADTTVTLVRTDVHHTSA